MTESGYIPEGSCEICGKLTDFIMWNSTFEEYDFVCRECQEEIESIRDTEDEYFLPMFKFRTN